MREPPFTVFTNAFGPGKLTAEDKRALTPLIYAHVNPYGIFRLDMNARLLIDPVYASAI